MEHDFWRERWDQGQLGFHQTDTHPLLERYWPELGLEGGRVLVPLCGKSRDLDWLARQGHEVWGVEFVEKAVDAYFAERNVVPTRETRGQWSVLRGRVGVGPEVSLVVADFFGVDPSVTGVCDAIYDRAAWVAIAPEDRRRYAARCRELLRPGGGMLLINFEHDVGSGPPHSIPVREVTEAYAGFSLELCFQRDILEQEPRFRERGATYFIEQVWLARAKP